MELKDCDRVCGEGLRSEHLMDWRRREMGFEGRRKWRRVVMVVVVAGDVKVSSSIFFEDNGVIERVVLFCVIFCWVVKNITTNYI